MEGDPKLLELQELIPSLQPGLGRSARGQALYQLASVFSTIGVAALGVLRDFVLKLPYLASPSDDLCFDDELFSMFRPTMIVRWV